MRQIGSPLTSTRIIDSFGRSLVAATRCLTALLNACRKILLDLLPDLRHRQAIENLTEESLHEHPLGDRPGNAPALEVETVLGIDRSDRRAVTAAQDVVVQDFEAGLG